MRSFQIFEFFYLCFDLFIGYPRKILADSTGHIVMSIHMDSHFFFSLQDNLILEVEKWTCPVHCSFLANDQHYYTNYHIILSQTLQIQSHNGHNSKLHPESKPMGVIRWQILVSSTENKRCVQKEPNDP